MAEQNEREVEEEDLNRMRGDEKNLSSIRIQFSDGDVISLQSSDITAGFYSFLVNSGNDEMISIEGSEGDQYDQMILLGRILEISDLGKLLFDAGLHMTQQRDMIRENENKEDDKNGDKDE
jgi:hypothetical protein